ncbi:MAG: SUMF1/EgtB/PvdO family nonheme iron enzyme [Deltaproteobacteria bacterium]|nr:SUMF1/EgtB/PvdO family nonheme iron enzyme [Deltaproteobacteria bacterium]
MERERAEGRGGRGVHRGLAIVGVLAAGMLSAMAGGCGSDSETPIVCKAGETRVCVGPGACQGGQLCTPQGSWSGCDCGSGGADGGIDAPSDVSTSEEAEASVPAPCEKNGKCPTSGMVEIQWPGGKGSYWIDAYEVRGAEYAVFEQEVTGGYVPPVTDKACEANGTYVRDSGCLHHYSTVTDAEIAEAGAYCVDYCDARAYCEWSGKHLCKLNAVHYQDGGYGSEDDEWANACSNGGQSPSSSNLPHNQCSAFDPPCPDVVPGLYDMQWSFEELVEVVDKVNPAYEDYAGLYGFQDIPPPGAPPPCYLMDSREKLSPGYSTSFRCCK